MTDANGHTTFTPSGWVTIADAPHVIELDWQSSTTGSLNWWIDKTPQTSLTNVDNSARRIDRVRLGAVAGVDATTNGTLYFDAFESRRNTYIGPMPSPVVTTTISYVYDPLYRLKEANYSDGRYFHYTYDAVGNRLTEEKCVILPCGTPITNTYAYDIANRLTSVNGQTYTWDNNGNLLNDGTSTYTYDAANRLTSVTQGTTLSSYSYNGLGDRLSQTVDSVTTNYVLDLNAGLTQVLADGTNTYLYGMSRIGELQPSGFVYHLGDALGSVRQLTDASGGVTLARSYEPYGSVLTSAGTGATTFAFTGEQYDAATNLTFLRSRYYTSSLGRFFQQDSWGGDLESPLTLDKYLYANGNPVLYTDPSGQWCVMGFSWGPGDPCTEAEAEYWASEYQAAATLFHGIGSDPQKRDAFAAGFLTEFIDDISVIQGVSLLNACLDVALDAVNGNNSASQQRRTFRQTDPYYLAGRVHARIFALEIGVGEFLLGAAGVGGGTTVSLSGIGALIGVPTATLSAVMAVHGAAVVTAVAAKQIADPIPSLTHLMSTTSSGSKRPVNRDGVPYPKQRVKNYGEVPFPKGNTVDIDPSTLRAEFNDSLKERFRKWWEGKYSWYPDSDTYAIHHIKPLSKGGNNDFDNLVPLKYGEEHNQFTRWWLKYP